MIHDISVEELLQLQKDNNLLPIDVRSPSEYAAATIPGSINIPIFNDEERAEIGTLYKQVNVQAAKERGLEIVSAKLPAFIREFAAIPQQKAVFCWRGGMRSRTSATVLSLMGIKAYRLTGGIRAYRKWVVDQLASYELQAPAIVLNGHTGSGKTEILRQLQQEGYPVLDLEGMAGHRGSVFGHIGYAAHNQKTFDALLLQELLQHQQAPYMLFEAESQRIGKVALPEFLLTKKEQGTHLWIDLPMEARIRHIIEDYKPEQHAEACMEAFLRIKERIHTPIAAEIQRHLESSQYEDAVGLLLQYYYDPRYEHTASHYDGDKRVTIQANSVMEAAGRVKEYLAAQQNR
ncbi:tRNA 2-selenouridine(34) synthase MnmH [Paenibacillus campinasensis]|uniref:tRNA 2-selenouridine(34) synthase MnmH n=1 Tax=Paenibacillus campinasensis TaxID=66347 RepID=A0ABW9T7B9_9BACL|nr:tRNA 2-selenouridine(34) synthase MnmH [Paenibacillus campinasensis]MUG67086.1 tRNA 2-selenouridine(34) synthase MnmH [Paenibacillus campinasensis]